jgi:hypothetical protein
MWVSGPSELHFSRSNPEEEAFSVHLVKCGADPTDDMDTAGWVHIVSDSLRPVHGSNFTHRVISVYFVFILSIPIVLIMKTK